MAVADRQLTSDEQLMLNRMLSFPPKKQERLLELSRLYQASNCDSEQLEIVQVLAEILFGENVALESAPLEESSLEGKKELKLHREYVGRQVLKFRREKGLSQGELAKLSGLPQSHISRIENGKHVSTFYTIKKLAKAMKVRMDLIDPSFEFDD